MKWDILFLNLDEETAAIIFKSKYVLCTSRLSYFFHLRLCIQSDAAAFNSNMMKLVVFAVTVTLLHLIYMLEILNDNGTKFWITVIQQAGCINYICSNENKKVA